MVDVYVPCEGPTNAKIAIVGESPGHHEVRARRPFVGVTGQQLDRFLGEVGLNRQDIFITNAVKYIPKADAKGKKDKWFFVDGQVAKGPTPDFQRGIDEVKAELLEVKPNVVVPMGNFALYALMGTTNITSYRGSILNARLIPGLKTIPTIHPSYILRVWKEYPLFVWDLQRAKEESEYPDIRLPSREFVIQPTGSEINEAITRLSRADTITIDTEWFSPDDISCIGFTDSKDWAICIPANHPLSSIAYRSILDLGCRKVFQSGIFDITALERAGYYTRMYDDDGSLLIEDTQLAQKVTWPDLRSRLELICSVYTKEPYYKDERKIVTSVELSHSERLYNYNCKDTSVTHEAWLALQKEMDDFDTKGAYALNIKGLTYLKDATVAGIKCDIDKLHAMMEEKDVEARKYKEILDTALGCDFNPRGKTQVRALIYGTFKEKPRAKSPTDQPTLMDIASQTKSPASKAILTLIIRCREALNARSKYLNDTLYDIDGRIRSSWNLGGTKNGRYSAGMDDFRGRGASLQTFPEDARRVCIADEGYILFKPDQEAAEARVVAHLCGDDRLLSWMDTGLDTHAMLTETIYGIPYKDVIALGKDTKANPKRHIAKVCKHGTNYRMGPIVMRLSVNKDYHETEFGIDTATAKKIIATILENHPLKVWWDEVQSKLRKDRFLTNCLGRKRHFVDRWGDPLINDAIAFEPQSTVADVNKIGLERVQHHIKETWPDDPLATVLVDTHDGALIQIPEGNASYLHAWAATIAELMSVPLRINGTDFTIPIEVAVGYNWGEMGKVDLG